MTPIRMSSSVRPLLAIAFVFAASSFASAATFSVNPTQIMLSAKTSSTLLKMILLVVRLLPRAAARHG